ncbi:phosphoribosylformylglycinamidine synthase subunit PurS [Alicyclobacillus cellulosilyticus]|uniref:Phosphoribosylformylglycinamidine synthase subunit PurS n=1 Tax=Alicyclobacillus cellulosilyticus TaxID=1003997 RepID=A0A917NLB2_9BACL|nr:phosphoribosylformylglycinamidine synthase subunit PurS [Alicyclobacillus cellulosilyticus]GGJ09813.1 phosphoribosylformylglycinamidine synthase subunit PurS [Alicyclobacillus cellulosilyticus]
MATWKAQVRVWLKPSVFDPQGRAVEQALHSLGYTGVGEVRIGKYMELRLEAASEAEAAAQVRAMCDAVLVNPVMETYAFSLEPWAKDARAEASA